MYIHVHVYTQHAGPRRYSTKIMMSITCMGSVSVDVSVGVGGVEG